VETAKIWVEPVGVDGRVPVVLITVSVVDGVLFGEDGGGVDWDNLLIGKLGISNGKSDIPGDWIHNLSISLLPDPSLWGDLNFRDDLMKTTLSANSVDIQMSVNAVEEGFGVDLVVIVLVVVLAEGGNKVVPVPDEIFTIVVVVGVGVVFTGGEGGLLILEQGDQWIDILVEVDRVDEVLLEGWDLPETLEVDGSHVPLEHWVLPILTEDGKGVVDAEEGVSNNLVQAVDGLINNFILKISWDLNVISVGVGTFQGMPQQFFLPEKLISYNGTVEFEEGVGVPVQLQKVPGGLASHGGYQESGNNDELHVEFSVLFC